MTYISHDNPFFCHGLCDHSPSSVSADQNAAFSQFLYFPIQGKLRSKCLTSFLSISDWVPGTACYGNLLSLTFIFRSHQEPNFGYPFSYCHINDLSRGKSTTHDDHIGLSFLLDLGSHVETRESPDFHAMTASISTFHFICWLPGEYLLNSSSSSTHCKYNGPAMEFLPGQSAQSKDLVIGNRHVEIVRQVSMVNACNFLFEDLAGFVQAVSVNDGSAVVGEKIG